MGKLKKVAESNQHWELISPQSFAENTYNLAQSLKKNSFEKNEEEKGEKGKKCVARVC